MMFFRVTLAICIDSGTNASANCASWPPMKDGTTLRQVSTLPHRESGGVIFPPFLTYLAYTVE